MAEAPLLVPAGLVDQRGTWFKHRDGSLVHECVPGGHIWRRASPMSSRCIFCLVVYQRAVNPATEPCPARFEEPAP